MNILTKRAYEPPAEADGQRILVDRLWPRGISKDRAKLDFWARDVAPSDELRKWYGHDAEKWDEFKLRYFDELDAQPEAVQALLDRLQGQVVTFVYSSKEEQINNAAALKEYVERMLRR